MLRILAVLVIALLTSCNSHGEDILSTMFEKEARTYVFVNDEYKVYFSSDYRVPLVTLETVTKQDLKFKSHRTNDFRVDGRISILSQANDRDYRKSGYDRGHLSASSNSSRPRSVSQTYFYTNIAPQHPDLNRGVWKRLEDVIKRLAREKDVVVITGVGFRSCITPERLNGRVAIPDVFYKIFYVAGTENYYLFPNEKPKSNKIGDYRSNKEAISQYLCEVKFK